MNRPGPGAVIVASVLVAGALVASWAFSTNETEVWTDGRTIRASGNTPVREVLWEPPTRLLAPRVGTPDTDEYEPRRSADGTVVVFVRNRPGSNADLYTTRWSPDGWSDPAPITSINTAADELGPELSHDGTSLYFYSNRPGGLGGYDLWVARAGADGWGTPLNLGPAVNSRWNEYGPALDDRSSRLYFSSNRPRPGEPAPTDEGWPATLREHRARHDYDLYVSTLTDGQRTDAAPLLSINTHSDEGSPAISPAGDFLYFATDRTGGAGGLDLCRVRLLPSDRIGPVERLSGINSPANELDPALSSDGFRLTFSSDRAPPPDAPHGAHDTPANEAPSGPRYTLWTSTSREVYREVTPGQNRLAALWHTLWPWLLLFLLAAAPFLMLWRLLRNPLWRRRFGQLSLLTQCLLLAMLLHAGLASLFTVWKIGTAITDSLPGEGRGTRVIIASGLSGDALVAQVRASISPQGLPALPSSLLPPALVLEPIELTSADIRPGPMALVETPAVREAATRSHSPGPGTDQLIAPPAVPGDLAIAVPAPENPSAALGEPGMAPATLPAAAGSPPSVDLSFAPSEPVRVKAPGPVAVRSVDAVSAQSLPPARAAIGLEQIRPVDAASLGAPALAANSRLPASPTAAAGVPEPGVHSAPPPSPAPLPPPNIAVSETGVERVDVPPPASPAGGRTGAEVAALPEAAVPQSRSRHAPAMASMSIPEPSGVGPDSDIRALAIPVPRSTVAASREPELSPADPGLHSTLPPAATLATLAPSGADSASTRLTPPPRSSVDTPSGARGSGAPPASALASIDAGVRPTPRGPDLPLMSPAPPAPRKDTQIALGIPAIPAPLDSLEQRSPESRAALVEQMGGSARTERAVGLALDWFLRHQSRDGHWSADHYDDDCGQCDSAAEIKADTAMTGMVLLCYLGAGHTHQREGPYRDAVGRGLRWLVARQDKAGDLRRGETMYGQTVAAVALCEAFAMTRDPALADPARRAVEFVLARAAGTPPTSPAAPAARPVATDQDTPVLGWLVFTVESARRAGFDVPQATFQSARNFLDSVASAAQPGAYAYTRRGKPSPAMTAEAMFVQQLLGRTRHEPLMQQSARYVLTALPEWRPDAPTFCWYYATLALFQHQGDAWRAWNDKLVPELLAHQEQAGAAAGSWAPTDQWSRLGGRVYQTAVCTLSLEVYYRYKTE